MKRRWLAISLALLMVMGTVGMVAAQEDDVDLEEKEGQGPPQHIQDMLDKKAELKGEDNDDDDDDQQGLPAFVQEMLLEKFTIMNKNKLKIHGNPFVSDLPPVIKEGRTLIPVGAVVKGLGAEKVEWDDDTKTVTIIKGDVEIVLEIGESVYTVSNKKDNTTEVFIMDTAAEILGNRTFVPLRFIAIALGEEIEYDEETKMINVGRALGQERAAEARAKNEDKEDDEEELQVTVVDDDEDDDE